MDPIGVTSAFIHPYFSAMMSAAIFARSLHLCVSCISPSIVRRLALTFHKYLE